MNASRFGKVAVLYGGWSDERSVSLDSGAAVHSALVSQGVDAVLVDASPESVLGLKQAGFDRAFVALHGRGGEDGQVQAVLELLGLPYTGSGMAASAIAMDKLLTKRVWKAAGLPTPNFRAVGTLPEARLALAELGMPLFMKPAREGSSVGLSRVADVADLEAAFSAAQAQDSCVLMEAGITGREFTAAILGDRPLPLIQIIPANAYYDYAAKYELDTTRYEVPNDLRDTQVSELQTMALRAFKELGCSGWGRVDFMLDSSQKPWLLEANTSPGMTSHSLVPMAAKAAGMSFEELVVGILEQTLVEAA